MPLEIDHVTIAASRLEAIAGAFAGAGLASDYGGSHSNGVTHMSVVSFPDGSYIELVSTMRPGLQSPWWNDHIQRDGGPCGWAVRSTDVGLEAERLRALDVSVDGPHRLSRSRPGGDSVEWDMALVGDGGIGAVYPFVIQDCTERALRTGKPAVAAGLGIVGVDTVVVSVPDTAAACEEFGRVYGTRRGTEDDNAELEARVLALSNAPVAFAAPAGSEGWLASRLDLLGPSPCAILLACEDLPRTAGQLGVGEPVPFVGREVAWFTSEAMWPLRLGLVGA